MARRLLPAIDFNAPSCEVARALVGVGLFVDGVGGTIVETEAYDQSDRASHTFAGRTARNAAMFGPSGCAYVYRSYGLHWCLNVVCKPAGHGAGVLIRALEPTAGVALMRERRSLSDRRLLCAGPGRLCQALAVTRAHDGCRLDRAPFRLTPRIGPVPAIGVGQRIGLTRARDVPWRFVLEGSPFLSRSMPRAAVHTGRP